MKIEEITQRTNLLANAADGTGKAKETQNTQEKAPAESGNAGTRVDISTASQEYRKVAEAMDAESPERVERVQQIKKAVETGQYRVDAQKVAEKVIQQSLLDIFGN